VQIKGGIKNFLQRDFFIFFNDMDIDNNRPKRPRSGRHRKSSESDGTMPLPTIIEEAALASLASAKKAVERASRNLYKVCAKQEINKYSHILLQTENAKRAIDKAFANKALSEYTLIYSGDQAKHYGSVLFAMAFSLRPLKPHKLSIRKDTMLNEDFFMDFARHFLDGTASYNQQETEHIERYFYFVLKEFIVSFYREAESKGITNAVRLVDILEELQ
jgi:hypothetical protein